MAKQTKLGGDDDPPAAPDTVPNTSNDQTKWVTHEIDYFESNLWRFPFIKRISIVQRRYRNKCLILLLHLFLSPIFI